MIDYTDPFAAQQAQAQASLQAAQQAKQYRAPQAQGMVGRVYVGTHPFQHIAELLRTRQAANQEEEATKQLQGIGEQRQQMRNQAMADFLRTSQGTPEFQAAGPAPQGAPQEGGYTVPAQKGDLMGAYGNLMNSGDQQLAQMGMHGIQQIPAMQQQAELKREALAQQAQENALNRQSREDMMRMQLEGQRQLRELTAGQRQAQIIDTDQGKMRVMPNGQLAPLMDMQGNAISGPKGPQGTAARAMEANQALQAIDQAEKVLPKATSSGIGNMLDQAAGFVGYSTPGAQNAAKLKAIEGELVSKMPKMSGPQSDKDVALYKQMAGVVGDANVPLKTRQEALQTVKEIQQRYAGAPMRLGNTGNPNSVMNQPAGGVVDFGSLK